MRPRLEFYFGVDRPMAHQTESIAVAIRYYQMLILG